MWTLTEGIVSLEGISKASYGISCGSIVINDISTRKEEICEFIELLNRLNASEVHAYDLVEDFLGK